MTGSKSPSPWWSQGVRFECQGSGKCCLSRGEYGYVYVNIDDRKRFAKYFGISVEAFTSEYCERTDGFYHLKEEPEQTACMFLKEHQCSAYEARPTQCRTWPFWPENMSAKNWRRDVQAFCPGVGKGPLVPAQRISEQMKAQKASEDIV